MPNGIQTGLPQKIRTEEESQFLLPQEGTPEGALLQNIRTQASGSRSALQQARDRIRNQKRSNAEMAFGVAAAMGRPTRTGAFGETMGNVAGALQGEMQTRRELDRQREGDLLNIEEQMRGVETGATSAEMDLMKLRNRSTRLQDVAEKNKKTTGYGESYKNMALLNDEFESMIYNKDFNGAVGWFDQFTGKLGAQLGYDEGLLTKEAEFAANGLIMQAAASLKGNLSDKDLKFLTKSQPSIGDSPDVWRSWYEKKFKPRVEASRQKAIAAGELDEDTQLFGGRAADIQRMSTGEEVGGYTFKGGDPNDASNWTQAKQTRRGIR